jgi:aminoglycoside phosphotransferase (APT) family kinase protein
MEEIRVLLHDLIGAATPVEAITPVPAGWSNQVYRVRLPERTLFLRVPEDRPALPGIDRAREAGILRQVAGAGLTPPIVHSDPVTGLLLTEGVEGVPLSTASADPAALKRVGDRLRQLHALQAPTAYVHHPARWALSCLEGAVTLGLPVSRGALREARALADLPLEHSCLCHHDLNPDNLLLGQRIWILDWEYAALGDPWMDLITVVETLDLGRPALGILADAAGLALPEPAREQELRRMHRLGQYAWALTVLGQGPARNEGALRLQRDRALALLDYD